MSASNFSFLSAHSPLLAELGATAERLYPYDPAVELRRLQAQRATAAPTTGTGRGRKAKVAGAA
jgi:hypothetical protein